MVIESSKRKFLGPGAWERHLKFTPPTPDDPNFWTTFLNHPNFHKYLDNWYLDINTKKVALKASSSVVGLVSYLGEEILFHGSGFIIENDDVDSIILTSAKLVSRLFDTTFELCDIKVVAHLSKDRLLEGRILAFDPHYNIAAVKIQANCPLPTASLKRLNDSITFDPNQLDIPGEKHFQLCPHSNSFNLIPGDEVIALGRHFFKPHDFMAAPGEFRAERSEFECRELSTASCHITECGIGGPLINKYGEVIGLSFKDFTCIPFLPINIVMKWWNQYKLTGKTVRPYIGMELSNLYAINIEILERFNLDFPNTFTGVFVEEVVTGSSADSGGISDGDVIVEFAGKTIQGFLELLEVMWDKVGQTVELKVLREGGIQLQLSMVVEVVNPDKFYRSSREGKLDNFVVVFMPGGSEWNALGDVLILKITPNETSK